MKSSKLTLRLFIVSLIAIPFACAVPCAFGKARYAGEEEMINRAEVIAIVNITEVEATKAKGKQWRYSEVASATVEQTLKGALPKEVKLYGGEDFVCAQVHFSPGRQLVFLTHDGELLIGCNWHLAVRPIKGDQIEWYIEGKYMELSWQPLQAVLARTRSTTGLPKEK